MDIDYSAIHYHEDQYPSTTLRSNSLSSNLLGGRFAIIYKLNDQNNLFLNFSTGYKSGGINQNPRLSEENQTYEPENNSNIDIGFRYKNNIMSFNITTFYMDRKDLQITLSTQQDENNPNSFYFYTSNASEGNNYGINMNLQFIPNLLFSSYLNIGLLNTNIDSYEYSLDTYTVITNPSREAAHAPSYSFSVGFTRFYNKFYLGLNIEGKDNFYFSDSHDQISKAFVITNMDLGYEMNSQTVISLWAKNLFNTKYSTRGFYFALEPPNWQDKLYLMYGDPFRIGISLKYTL